MEKIVILKNVYLKIEDKIILKNINIEIFKNDFILIKGHNGSGKTSLLKLIAGIYKPFKGNININRQKLKISYVPQNINYDKYLPMKTIDLLHASILTIEKKFFTFKKEKEIVERITEEFGIYGIIHKAFSKLSGGEKQKILLAMAILRNPDMLLLDEPLSSLDKKSKIQFVNLVKEIYEKYKIAILFVTHDTEKINFKYTKNINIINGEING